MLRVNLVTALHRETSGGTSSGTTPGFSCRHVVCDSKFKQLLKMKYFSKNLRIGRLAHPSRIGKIFFHCMYVSVSSLLMKPELV